MAMNRASTQAMMRVAKSLRSRGLRAAVNSWASAIEDARAPPSAQVGRVCYGSNGLRKALNSWCGRPRRLPRASMRCALLSRP